MGPDGVPVKNVNVHSGDSIYWTPYGTGEEIWNWGEYAFIEIVLKSGENITGYSVVRVAFINPESHSISVRKSVVFPQVDGKYQNVSEEYVIASIEEAKK